MTRRKIAIFRRVWVPETNIGVLPYSKIDTAISFGGGGGGGGHLKGSTINIASYLIVQHLHEG